VGGRRSCPPPPTDSLTLLALERGGPNSNITYVLWQLSLSMSFAAGLLLQRPSDLGKNLSSSSSSSSPGWNLTLHRRHFCQNPLGQTRGVLCIALTILPLAHMRVPGLGRVMTLALTTCSTEGKMDNIAFTVTVLTLPSQQPTLPADRFLLHSSASLQPLLSQPSASHQPAFSHPSASLQPPT
jgi:hypothetical protein